MLNQRLRLTVFVILVVILGAWARYEFTNRKVNSNPSSEADFAAARERAQPVLQALEKYRADNGLYPTTLDQMTPTYLPSVWGLHRYRYSARHPDWVFRSDACVAREKSLRGWTLKEAKEYQKEVAQFKLDCISGYHYYQLQSPDFPQDTQSRNIERWAYYDSQSKQWSLGWCARYLSRRGGAQESATNGICRWRHGGLSDPLSDPW